MYTCKLYKWLSSDLINHSLHQIVQNHWLIPEQNKWLFVSESLSHSLQWFVKKCWFVDEFTSDCLCEWVIEPFIQNSGTCNSGKTTTTTTKIQVAVFMSESLNHSHSMIRSKVLIHSGSFKRGSLYEWVNSTSSFKYTINSWTK